MTAEPREVSALLQIRRTGAGDSLHLVRVDTLRIEGPSVLTERWKRFPFQGQLKDSISATDAEFKLGLVRYVLADEGFAPTSPRGRSLPRDGRTWFSSTSPSWALHRGAGSVQDGRCRRHG